MDFDDFFENSGKHRKQGHGHYDEHHHSENHRHVNEPYHSEHGSSGLEQLFNIGSILENIKTNRSLKIALVLVIVFLLVLLLIVLILLLPLIGKLVNYVSENGIQGVLGGLSGFLDKLWSGSGAK